MLQEIKQGKRNILLNGIGEVSGALVHDEIDGAVSKHRHPHERKVSGNKQHASHELTNCPAAGNACNEHTYKRRP